MPGVSLAPSLMPGEDPGWFASRGIACAVVSLTAARTI
jgi:hypothetical protein